MIPAYHASGERFKMVAVVVRHTYHCPLGGPCEPWVSSSLSHHWVRMPWTSLETEASVPNPETIRGKRICCSTSSLAQAFPPLYTPSVHMDSIEGDYNHGVSTCRQRELERLRYEATWAFKYLHICCATASYSALIPGPHKSWNRAWYLGIHCFHTCLIS